MSIIGDLMGRTSARSAEQLGQRSMGRINEGYDNADRYSRQGYDTSIGRFQPFADTSRRGYDLWADSYGINGADAQNRAFGQYQNDPFYQHSSELTNNLLRNIMRQSASRGMGNSGASALAMGRAGLEAQDRRIGEWRGGLGQFGNQALGIAGTMSGFDRDYYGGMADRSIGRVNAINGIDANSTMAANNARMAGVNNLMRGLGTLGGQAIGAFAPGGGGRSAFS
jgi:hypothetical protein